MKKNTKTILRDFIISTYPFYKKKNGKRILCFHDIQHAGAFEERIKWLMLHFEIISLGELLNAQRENLLAITFDDAYESWVKNVVPVLDKYKLPATFFVNSGLVGLKGKEMEDYFFKNCKRNPTGLQALSKEGLTELAENPLFEIGGHSKDHFLFSKNTLPADLAIQINFDKKRLEQMTKRQLKYFAYPFGQHIHATENIREAVKNAGYKNAFTIVPGFLNVDDNPYLLSRDSLELFQSKKVWNRWLHGAYDQLVKSKNGFYKFFGFSYR